MMMSSQTLKAEPAAQADDPLAPIAIPPQPPFKEDVADIGDAKLWYTDTGGTGVPVVLLHPASGSGLIWSYQRPALVAAGFRVIAYSRRGCYGSSPVDKANPGVGSRDLLALADRLGLEAFHVVGCAAGGGIAADFAFSYPQRLRSIVVSSNPFAVSEGVTAATAARIRPEAWDELPRWFRELGPSYRAANEAGIKAWVELEHRGAEPEGARQKRAHKVTEAMLATLRTPALLMTGAADTSTPPATQRIVARKIPGCEIFIVPECGHSAYWERPDIFNMVVTEFLARH
jgi:pimeloyl-ACP methyl ester carboxylesterase